MVALLGVLLAIGGGSGVYVYYYVPLLPFDPVCRDYQRGRSSYDWLHTVSAPLSAEFKRAVVQHFEAIGEDVSWFEIVDGDLRLKSIEWKDVDAEPDR